MAGVNKNFIVKNGLEVGNGLIFTDVANSVVGIASTTLNPAYELHVVGGIGATSLTVTGVTTTTSAVITSSAVVGSAVTINSSGVGANNLNVSGIVTSSSYYVGTTTVFNTVSGQVTLAGIQTIDSATKASLERELALSPNQFDDISVTGISTLSGIKITSGIVTAVSGVATYYGDGTNLTGVTAVPAGTINNVQYNNGSVTAGSNNFVFTGTHVGIGTTNPAIAVNASNTSILNVGVVTANFVYGSVIGNLTGNVDSTGVSTFTTLKVGTGVTISGGIVTATSFYGDGANLTNAGATLQAGSGTQNILLTSLTSGIVTSASIDQTTLQWNHNTNTLNTTNINLTDNLYVTGISSLGVTTTTNLTSQQLNVTGLSTFAGVTTSTSTLFANELSVSGVSTFVGVTTNNSTIFGTQLSVSGVSTFAGITTSTSSLFANNISVAGVSTFAGIATNTSTLFANQLSVAGVSTFAGIATNTSTLFANQLSVAGVSTFAGITTVTGDTLFAKQVSATGVSTFTNSVGIGTDQLVPAYCLSLGGSASVCGGISLCSSIAFTNNAIFNSNIPSSGTCNVFMNGAGGGGNTGSNNVFIEPNAGRNNTTGSNNIFLGAAAGIGNTIGAVNIFLGLSAGAGNKSGNNNVAIGCIAGSSLDSGSDNVFIGRNAGASVGNSSDNVMIGNGAGYFSTGSDNVLIGFAAGAIGANNSNVIIGYCAGVSLCGSTADTSTWNVLIGRHAGCTLTTGSSNIIIGDTSYDCQATTLKGFTTESNRISIGHRCITNFYTKMAAKSWNCTTVKWDATTYELAADTSSCRFKTNIEPFLGGVDEILKLNSVKYNPIENPDGHYEIGLIAEEVAESGLTELVAFDVDNQPLSVSYDRMAALFINAIKELHQENQQLKQEIVEIKKHLDL